MGTVRTMAARIVIGINLQNYLSEHHQSLTRFGIHKLLRLKGSVSYVSMVLLSLRRNTHNLQVKLIPEHHRERCKYEGFTYESYPEDIW